VRRRGSACIILACLAGLVAAGTAAAAPVAMIGDDRMAGEPRPGEPTRAERFRDILALGATRVQTELRWRVVAPRRRPANGANPADAAYDWHGLDAGIRAAVAAGLDVHLRIFDTPEWAGGSVLGNYAPADLQDLRDFAEAAGRRYSGRFTPAGASTPLPRVAHWVAWNEPNGPQFLMPQYRQENGQWVPESPRIYAGILKAIYDGLRAGMTAAGAEPPVIAGGATAGGGDNNPNSADDRVPPGRFIAELAKFDPVMDAWSHHAYPLRPPSQAGRETIPVIDAWNMEKLGETLDAAGGRLVGLPIWISEIGVFVEDTEKIKAWADPVLAAVWLEEAYKRIAANPRVEVFGVYFLQDNPDWRTGLRNRAFERRPAWGTICRAFNGVDGPPRCPAKDVEAEEKAKQEQAVREREAKFALFDFRPETLEIGLRLVRKVKVVGGPVMRLVRGRRVPVLERRVVRDELGRTKTRLVPKMRERTAYRTDSYLDTGETAFLLGRIATKDKAPLKPGTVRVMVRLRRPGSVWRRIGYLPFDASGTFRVPVHPLLDSEYQAIVQSSGGSQSPAVVGRVRPTFIRFATDRRRAVVGRRATFRARLVPFVDVLSRRGICLDCHATALLEVRNEAETAWRTLVEVPVGVDGRIQLSRVWASGELGGSGPLHVRMRVEPSALWPFGATVSPEILLNAPRARPRPA
jgi:hypothetical protein